MAKARVRVVCVHTLNGRPIFVRLDEDKFLLSKNPVVAIIRDKRYEVKESREKINSFIKDAEVCTARRK